MDAIILRYKREGFPSNIKAAGNLLGLNEICKETWFIIQCSECVLGPSVGYDHFKLQRLKCAQGD